MATRVIGVTREVQLTPTITAGAYSSGQAIGGKLTFPNVCNQMQGSTTIQSIQILDLSKQKSAIDVVFFIADFTPTANGSTFNPSGADALNARAVSIAASDYMDFSAQSLATIRNVGLALVTPQAGATSTGAIAVRPTIIYAQLVSRGTPTFTSTTALTVTVQFYLD